MELPHAHVQRQGDKVTSTKQGIVIRAANGIYTVQFEEHLFHCALRGNLKKDLTYNTSGSLPRRLTRAKRAHVSDTIAIGDRVRFAEAQQGAGVIEEILPRWSRFTRCGFRGREQTLISNLDQVLIVFACAEPRMDPWKLDRFLAAAESESVQAIIVANKRDLVGEQEFRGAFSPFASIGYRVIPTSVLDGTGVESLRACLDGKVSAVVGPSGAGKSSLLNAVQPGLNLKTGDIGYVTFKGRHTTTSSQLIPLRSGGWVADTPGLRNFELLQMSRDELLDCFPEIRAITSPCKFDDCRHSSEPGCAIKAAVQEGGIQQRRYESFLVLAAEVTAHQP